MTGALVIVAGALGALVRWQAAARLPNGVGLLAVNIAGSFVVGLLDSTTASVAEPVAYGALGALTSYSALSLLGYQLRSRRSTSAAALYVSVSLALCIAAAALGRALA